MSMSSEYQRDAEDSLTESPLVPQTEREKEAGVNREAFRKTAELTEAAIRSIMPQITAIVSGAIQEALGASGGKGSIESSGPVSVSVSAPVSVGSGGASEQVFAATARPDDQSFVTAVRDLAAAITAASQKSQSEDKSEKIKERQDSVLPQIEQQVQQPSPRKRGQVPADYWQKRKQAYVNRAQDFKDKADAKKQPKLPVALPVPPPRELPKPRTSVQEPTPDPGRGYEPPEQPPKSKPPAKVIAPEIPVRRAPFLPAQPTSRPEVTAPEEPAFRVDVTTTVADSGFTYGSQSREMASQLGDLLLAMAESIGELQVRMTEAEGCFERSSSHGPRT